MAEIDSLCGSLAVYFLALAAGAVILRRPWHWLLFRALSGAAAPAALTALGGHYSGVIRVWLLAVVVGWQAVYVWGVERPAARS